MSRQLYQKEEFGIDASLSHVGFTREQDGRTTGEFKGLRLTSAFQPVVSVAHRRTVGHEALLRAHTAQGNPVPPLDVFRTVNAEDETTHLDRLCRELHVRNYRTMGEDNSWLFLNVNPTVVVHGKAYGPFFSNLLDYYGFPAHRIVVEILEGAIHDESRLAEAVEYYRELGCLVAIDDFGTGHSNFERIWRLAPEIVKLDRSVIVQAVSKKKVRRVLPSLISLLHEAGCLVLMEGVETEDEALVSMDADVDFVQGYYFGRPAPTIDSTPGYACSLTGLCDKFKLIAVEEAKAQNGKTVDYLAGFRQCVAAMESGIPIETACVKFIAEAAVERCYLLDAEGVQIGANLTLPFREARADPRFNPLRDVSGAQWFRRVYFRRAISQPGQVQMSRPYLSLTGAHMCVTMSVGMDCDGETRVFCCDLNWESVERG